jgi:hypothetical protein
MKVHTLAPKTQLEESRCQNVQGVTPSPCAAMRMGQVDGRSTTRLGRLNRIKRCAGVLCPFQLEPPCPHHHPVCARTIGLRSWSNLPSRSDLPPVQAQQPNSCARVESLTTQLPGCYSGHVGSLIEMKTRQARTISSSARCRAISSRSKSGSGRATSPAFAPARRAARPSPPPTTPA